jgi:hypothetical protein
MPTGIFSLLAMNAHKTTEVSLPVGETLGWDTNDVIEDDKKSLKSIAERS